jgi:hypothetical protein
VLAHPALKISAAASAKFVVKKESRRVMDVFIGAVVLAGNRVFVQCGSCTRTIHLERAGAIGLLWEMLGVARDREESIHRS